MDNIELETQRTRVKELVTKTNKFINVLNTDADNNMTLDLIYKLKIEVINLNIKIIDILEGQKSLRLYSERYFKIAREVLSRDDMNIRDLKDYIIHL